MKLMIEIEIDHTPEAVKDWVEGEEFRQALQGLSSEVRSYWAEDASRPVVRIEQGN